MIFWLSQSNCFNSPSNLIVSQNKPATVERSSRCLFVVSILCVNLVSNKNYLLSYNSIVFPAVGSQHLISPLVPALLLSDRINIIHGLRINWKQFYCQQFWPYSYTFCVSSSYCVDWCSIWCHNGISDITARLMARPSADSPRLTSRRQPIPLAWIPDDKNNAAATTYPPSK